jgi:hypothetical protein
MSNRFLKKRSVSCLLHVFRRKKIDFPEKERELKILTLYLDLGFDDNEQ